MNAVNLVFTQDLSARFDNSTKFTKNIQFPCTINVRGGTWKLGYSFKSSTNKRLCMSTYLQSHEWTEAATLSTGSPMHVEGYYMEVTVGSGWHCLKWRTKATLALICSATDWMDASPHQFCATEATALLLRAKRSELAVASFHRHMILSNNAISRKLFMIFDMTSRTKHVFFII